MVNVEAMACGTPVVPPNAPNELADAIATLRSSPTRSADDSYSDARSPYRFETELSLVHNKVELIRLLRK